jgi:hypothetical protein
MWSCAKIEGVVFKEPVSHRESKILERHLMSDHIYVLREVPPK